MCCAAWCRAMRHAHMLGTKEPLLWQLVLALKTQMAAAYPELERASALIVETLRHEEERFRDMLGRGLKLSRMNSTNYPAIHCPARSRSNLRHLWFPA